MKIYIFLNKFNMGIGEVVSIAEDLTVFGVINCASFGNGAIPAFVDFQEADEYLDKYKEKYGEQYELVIVPNFEYPEELKEVLKRYRQANGQEQ